jgi:hypothetical protein
MRKKTVISSIDAKALKILALKGKPIKLSCQVNNKLISLEKPLNLLKKSSKSSNISLQNSISISELELKMKDPTEALHEKHKNLVLASQSLPKYFFDLFIGLLILYSTISSLFYLAFVKSNAEDYFTDMVISLVFLTDLILSFFTSFTDKKGREVKNLQLIAKNYLKTWMIPDFLSLLPLKLMFKWSNVEYCLRLLRFLKIRRYARLVNILKVSQYLCDFFRVESKLKRRKFCVIFGYLWDLAMIFTFLLIVCFAVASLWWYFCGRIKVYFKQKENFIDSFGLDKEDEFTRALRTLHFVFSTMVTAGFGDYYSMNSYEMIINIIFILLGPSFFAYLMGSAIGIIRELHFLSAKQNYSQDFNRWLSLISSKSNKHIPLKLKIKINNFLCHFPKVDLLGSIANKSLETDPEEKVLEVHNNYMKELPDYYKHQILDFLFAEIFYCFKYFFGNDKHFKYLLSLYFQPRLFNQEVILEIKEKVFEVLFVIKGNHQLENQEGEVLCSLDKYRIVGDFFCYFDKESSFRFRAVGILEGFAVPAHVFKVIAKELGTIDKYFNVVKENYERILDNGKESGRSWATFNSSAIMNVDEKENVVNLIQSKKNQRLSEKTSDEIINQVLNRYRRLRIDLKSRVSGGLLNLLINSSNI